MAAAAVAAGAAVEKTYGRARFTSHSISDRLPATNPPTQPSALLKRADADVDAIFHAQVLGHAAAVRGRTRPSRGPRPPAASRRTGSAKSASSAKRRQVAVHAEQAVGDDQPPAIFAGPRPASAVQPRPVAVRIDADVGPRKPAAVPKAGVVLAVAEDHVAGSDQGGDRAQVGGEAGGKQQRGLGPLELRPAAASNCRCKSRMPGHQRTGPAAPAFAPERTRRRPRPAADRRPGAR